MTKITYFVCYQVKGRLRDTTVTLEGELAGSALVEALRHAVHPDRPADPSDNCQGQRASDCVLVNFIQLDCTAVSARQ